MAEASAHDEQMENLMGAKRFMSGIEQRQLQRIDNPANGVDDSACQKPAESGTAQVIEKLGKGKNADPAHADIKNGGKPFGAGDPAGLDDHAGDGNHPDQG